MKEVDILIVGGSAAGITAAVTARKHYSDKKIVMVKNVVNVPIPCGIPYIFGTIGDPSKNTLPTDKMMESNSVETIQDEVIKIDRANKTASTKGGLTIKYEKMILANGSLPMIPRLPGIDLGHVYPIIKDIDALKKMFENMKSGKRFVIIGGGFIGVEMAEELKKMNPEAAVTVIEMQNHCLQLVYDEDFSALAEQALREQGINLVTGKTVVALEGTGDVAGVRISDGETIPADRVILGIGCTPNTELAKMAELKIGPARGVAVNRYMQTSDPDIYACGDVADKISFFDGVPSALRLASIATQEARIAGANLYNTKRVNQGAIGVFSTFIGKKTFAAAGLTIRDAQAKGYQIVSSDAESINRHPGGMPGGEALKVRLVFEKGNKVLLGGQVYGATSGGELINVIGALISSKVTAEDIVLFQAGTHPALTASPVAYQLVNAAENALVKLLR